MKQRVLVTGAAGMLGSQLLRSVPAGTEAVGSDLREGPGVDVAGIDLAEPEPVARLFKEHGPFTGVIHTAAFTAVDLAEEKEAEARRVNETVCRVLGDACRGASIPYVVVSGPNQFSTFLGQLEYRIQENNHVFFLDMSVIF